MLALAKVAAVGLVGWSMGGWAVVSVRDLPESFVAGQQYTIEFEVRQHGRELLSGLEPRLVVSSSGRRLGGFVGGKDETVVAAVARPARGRYAATFTAPVAPRVFLTIRNGFGGELRLYPVAVVATGASSALAPLTAAERGRDLFVAKGCNTCHVNRDLVDRPDNKEITAGPELTGRRLASAYVIQKLKNPSTGEMPDLGLSEAEVSALAVFLTGERAAAAGGVSR